MEGTERKKTCSTKGSNNLQLNYFCHLITFRYKHLMKKFIKLHL